MPKLSIIIPVYNSADYLRPCLGSVLNQNFSDFELIIVDDGSKDGSREIIEEYAKKDIRIKLIFHEINKGVGPARNSGLAAAKGEFIAFVDSDDWLEKNMYSSLITRQAETDADIVECNVFRHGETPVPVQEFKNMPSELNLSKDNDAYLLAIYNRRAAPYIFNKIYRAALIKKNAITFPNNQSVGVGGEDLIFLLILSHYIKSYASLNKPNYNYRYLIGSLSHRRIDSPADGAIRTLNFLQSEHKKRKQLMLKKYFLTGALVLIKLAVSHSFTQTKSPVADGATTLRLLGKNDFIQKGIKGLLFYRALRFKDCLLVWLLFVRAYRLYSLLSYHNARRQPGFLLNI
jgi:glycosyltransferase involved in cell wall biosynthesis